jgi:hypothetical protein
MKNKQTKEMKKIEKAVADFIKKHDGNCIVNFTMCAFNEDGDVYEDQMWLHGLREVLLISNEGMKEEIEKNF